MAIGLCISHAQDGNVCMRFLIVAEDQRFRLSFPYHVYEGGGIINPVFEMIPDTLSKYISGFASDSVRDDRECLEWQRFLNKSHTHTC